MKKALLFVAGTAALALGMFAFRSAQAQCIYNCPGGVNESGVNINADNPQTSQSASGTNVAGTNQSADNPQLPVNSAGAGQQADNPQSGNSGFELVNPLDPTGQKKCADLSCPLAAVTNFLFTLSIPIVGIFVLIGGLQMMMARGNPEAFSKGRRTIVYAAAGFFVVLIAGSVAKLIQSIFLGS